MNPAATQSPQSQAIYVANSYLTFAEQLMSMHDQLKVLATQWTDDGVANTLIAMHTVAINSDGSLATVNDGIPISTNPINPTAYPTLIRPVSSLQLSQLKTILDGIVTYIDGNVVTTQPGAHAILNAVIGG